MVTTNDDLNKKILFILALFLYSIIPVYRTVVDIGDGITHQNHEDTITTPLSGNCGNPGCPYPDCGGCNGQPQITLEPTVILTHIATVPNPATPDIPDPTQYPTTFPTFSTTSLIPTPYPTMGLPTVVPTLKPPAIPTAGIPL